MRSSISVQLTAATILALGLSCIFLAGCGGGEQGSSPVEEAEEEAGVEEVTDEGSAATEVELEPLNGSGASGTATLTELSGGVEVRLDLRRLPDPGVTYLSHLHPGTCGDEHAGHDRGGEDHEHDGTSAQEARSDEIDYPLTPVVSDAEGGGSSTTLLEDVTIEELLSGEPKYINVHAAGSGEDLPPDIACGGLN